MNISTKFIIWRISSHLIDCFAKFDKLAFDVFWLGDLFDDFNDFQAINEVFSDEDEKSLPDILGNSFLSILQEGISLRKSYNKVMSFDGSFIEGIHFLLSGKRQFYQHDFIVDRFFLAKKNHLKITLVNCLVGCRKIEKKTGMSVTYLQNIEVQEVISGLLEILKDDFEIRWKTLQQIDRDSVYFDSPTEKSLPENLSRDFGQRFIQSYLEKMKYRNSLSFSEFFRNVNEPRYFIEKTLLPFFLATIESHCGILLTRCY